MTLTNTRIAAVSAVAAAVLLAAGCSSSSSSSHASAGSSSASASTPVPKALIKQYLDSEKTVLTAIQTGADKMKKLKAPAAASDVQAALQPMVSATQTFDQQIGAMPWPAALQSKVSALQDADGAWLKAATGLMGTLTGPVPPDKVTGALNGPYDGQVAAVDHLRAAMNLPSL